MAEDKSIEPNNEEQESTKEEGKYSQDQVNKMMASKAKETETKLQAKFQAQIDELTSKYESQKDEFIKKGEELAKMDAEERAKAKLESDKADIERQRAEFKKEMDAFKSERALSETKEALIDAGLPKELAKHLSDVDIEKRSNNIAEFKELFNKAVSDAVDAKVSGKKTPETGNNAQPTSNTPEVTQADWDKMTMTEKTAFRQSSPENMQLADSFIHY